MSSIVCLLIRLRVADRLTSLESSLKVSRAFLIVASFRAMASRKAAGGGGSEGWRYEGWRGGYEGWRIRGAYVVRDGSGRVRETEERRKEGRTNTGWRAYHGERVREGQN